MHILHTLNFTFMYIHIFIQFNHYAWLNFELYFLKNMSIYFWELVYERWKMNVRVSARMKQGVRKWRSKKMNVDALSLSLSLACAQVCRRASERTNVCISEWESGRVWRWLREHASEVITRWLMSASWFRGIRDAIS